jgi:glutamine amidotransferase
MIAIVKYNAGNTASVRNAVMRLGYECEITDNREKLAAAGKVIFPGVGEAKSAMRYLKQQGLHTLIQSLKQPVLGICLGLQLMCRFSEEGDTEGLGIFDSVVRRFPPAGLVPHIGWNSLSKLKSPLFEGIGETGNFYFVHSYCADICDATIAVCDYLLPFSAALQKDNFYATQFHPEKSANTGETVLRNFLSL